MSGTPEDLNLSMVRDHINVCFPNDCEDLSMPQANDQMDLNSENPSVTSEVSQITNRQLCSQPTGSTRLEIFPVA
jgi:hypothetical protein